MKRNSSLLSVLFTAAYCTVLHAQTFQTIVRLNGADGQSPEAGPLTQGLAHNLFGVTFSGGAGGLGTVFRIDLGDTFSSIHSFCTGACTDYGAPATSLTQAYDANYYGGTFAPGGKASVPTLYRVTPQGAVTTLDVIGFTGDPTALTLASNGLLYGIIDDYPGGIFFSLTTSGAMTPIYNFCSLPNCLDGAAAQYPVVQGPDGEFYGTTYGGGPGTIISESPGNGTVFKVSSTGMLTTLHDFCSAPNCADGQNPSTGLTVGADGNFYGATNYGGANKQGVIFKITPSGSFNVLYNFCPGGSCVKGVNPFTNLMAASDGNLYGVDGSGGPSCAAEPSGCGVIFKLTLNGTYTALHTFCAHGKCPDGWLPTGIMQATWGPFYGTTSWGGSNPSCPDSDKVYNCGTIFKLDNNLNSFVKASPAAGTVGATIYLIGTSLSGATQVTYNGVPATFTVTANGGLATTVPATATSGLISVVLPSGTLSTTAPFFVY